jgi:hypothetical protein
LKKLKRWVSEIEKCTAWYNFRASNEAELSQILIFAEDFMSKRCLLWWAVYWLTFVVGVLASDYAAFVLHHPFARGLFAGVLTMYGAIFALSGAIRLICGGRALNSNALLREGARRELRELNS